MYLTPHFIFPRWQTQFLKPTSIPTANIDIDFTTSDSLCSFFTLTRSTNAIYINSQGYIAYVPPNTPRFLRDPNPDTGFERRGLHLGKAARNSVRYSENFYDATTWKSDALINNSTGKIKVAYQGPDPDVNTKTSYLVLLQDTNVLTPDGLGAATKFCLASGRIGAFTGQLGVDATAANTVYAIGIFVKPAELSVFQIRLHYRDNNMNGFYTKNAIITVNAVNLTSDASRYKFIKHKNGWYRFVCYFNGYSMSTGSTFNWYQIILPSSSGIVGTGSNGMYFWGAQYCNSTGRFIDDYVPTQSAAVTTVADVLTVASTEYANYINTNEGTIYMNYARNNNSGSSFLIKMDTDTGGSSHIRLNSSGRYEIMQNNSISVNITPTYPFTEPTPTGTLVAVLDYNYSKIAFKYKSNDCGVIGDTNPISIDTAAVLPTPNNMTFFTNQVSATCIKQFRVYPIALTDAQMASITQ